ncbi:MAG: DUF935 family protein, partial [Nitrospirales bacterium]|nr:DUF935 family protein [Nitrospirales bacterium]
MRHRGPGIWINDRDFVSFAEAARRGSSLTEEIATRKGAFDFYSLGMYLPNPDPVLRKQGKDITVYGDLLVDDHVGACVKSRKAGVKSLEWGIDRGKAKSRQARIIEELVNDLDMENIISEMLNATLYGYQVMEVLWKRVGGLILPGAVVGKPQQWFVFDEENRLMLRTKANYNGALVPERKFLLLQYEASYDNPYGWAELSRCFWPVTFKKGGLKFWAVFMEKYGMPFLLGKLPRGLEGKEYDALAKKLEDMVQDAVAVVPDDSSIEMLTAKGSGSGSSDMYDKFLAYQDNAVSKAILGQTLTTQIGKSGSYAASETHMQVRGDIVDSDKKLIERAFNQLITWIYELNFSGGERPVFSMWEEEDVDKDLAERDEKLTASMEKSGLRLTQKYYRKGYGLEEEDIEAVGSQTAQFAEDNPSRPPLNV